MSFVKFIGRGIVNSLSLAERNKIFGALAVGVSTECARKFAIFASLRFESFAAGCWGF